MGAYGSCRGSQEWSHGFGEVPEWPWASDTDAGISSKHTWFASFSKRRQLVISELPDDLSRSVAIKSRKDFAAEHRDKAEHGLVRCQPYIGAQHVGTFRVCARYCAFRCGGHCFAGEVMQGNQAMPPS